MAARYRILALGLCAALACGGDDGGGDVSTELPKDDKLSDLNGDDAVQACTAAAKAVNDLLPDEAERQRVTCLFAAMSEVIDSSVGELGAAAISECKKLSADCEAGKGSITADKMLQPVDEEGCKKAATSNPYEGCDATIAHYESCAGGIRNELRSRVHAVRCEDLSDVEALDKTLNGEIDLADIPECKAFQTECPDLDFIIPSA